MVAKYIFLSSALICYLSFAWSVIGVFKTQEVNYRQLFKALKLCSVTFWCYSLYLFSTPLEQSASWYIWGATVNAISLAIFIWSTRTIRNEFFSTVYGKDIPDKVIRKGPFRIVRNPFYSSYILCYFGATMTQQSFVLLGLLLGLVSLYLIAIKIEENKFYYSQDFHSFVQYKKTTGKLFPKLNFLVRKQKPMAPENSR